MEASPQLAAHSRLLLTRLVGNWLERRSRDESAEQTAKRFHSADRTVEFVLMQLSADAVKDAATAETGAATSRHCRQTILGFQRRSLSVRLQEIVEASLGAVIYNIDSGLQEVAATAAEIPWLPEAPKRRWLGRPPRLLQEGIAGLLRLALVGGERAFLHSADLWLDPRNDERLWCFSLGLRSFLLVPVVNPEAKVPLAGRDLAGFVALVSPIPGLFRGLEEELVETLSSFLTETWYLLRAGSGANPGTNQPWTADVSRERVFQDLLATAVDRPLVAGETLATVASIWEWNANDRKLQFKVGRIHEATVARRIEHLLKVGLIESGPWELPGHARFFGDGRVRTQLTAEGLLAAVTEAPTPRGQDAFDVAYRALIVIEDQAVTLESVQRYVDRWDALNRASRFEVLAGALRAFQYGERPPIVDLFVPLLDLTPGDDGRLQPEGLLRFNCRVNQGDRADSLARIERLRMVVTKTEALALLRKLAATLRAAGSLAAELGPWLTAVEARECLGQILREGVVCRALPDGGGGAEADLRSEIGRLWGAYRVASFAKHGWVDPQIEDLRSRLEGSLDAAVSLSQALAQFLRAQAGQPQLVVVLSLWLTQDDAWNRRGRAESEPSWTSPRAVELFPLYQMLRGVARLRAAGLPALEPSDYLLGPFQWEPRRHEPEVLLAGVVRELQTASAWVLSFLPDRGVEVCRFNTVGSGALNAAFMPAVEETPEVATWRIEARPDRDGLENLPLAAGSAGELQKTGQEIMPGEVEFHAGAHSLSAPPQPEGLVRAILDSVHLPEVALGKAFTRTLAVFGLPARELDPANPRQGFRYVFFWLNEQPAEGSETEAFLRRRLSLLVPFYNLSLFAFKERSFNESTLLSQWVHALALPLHKVRNQIRSLLLDSPPKTSLLLRNLNAQFRGSRNESRAGTEAAVAEILAKFDAELLDDWLKTDAGGTGLPDLDSALGRIAAEYVRTLVHGEQCYRFVSQQFRFTQAIVGFKQYAESRGWIEDYRSVPPAQRLPVQEQAASALLTAWSQLLDTDNGRYHAARGEFFPDLSADRRDRLMKEYSILVAQEGARDASVILDELSERYAREVPDGVVLAREWRTTAWLNRESRHCQFVRAIFEEILANAFRNIRNTRDGQPSIAFRLLDNGESYTVELWNAHVQGAGSGTGSSGTGQFLIENLLLASAGRLLPVEEPQAGRFVAKLQFERLGKEP